jgi:hypothetical protein
MWFLYVLLGVFIAVLLYITLRYRTEHFAVFDDPHIKILRARLERVFPEMRGLEMYASDSSSTIDKRIVYICMKDENGKYYDDNMLTHVMLHELAHTLQKEMDPGHSPKFQKIFYELLERAEQHGLYDSTKPLTRNYCNYK